MEKINIGGVPETMIQTLFARAKESQKPNHKIYDAKAIEIVSAMDYDFSNADKDFAMSSGVIARTIMLDKMVKDYVEKNPDAVIINIACGMDTRFYRSDNGRIKWYNIDLPVTIDVRNKFLKEPERVANIAKSAMDEAWADDIEKNASSYLVVIEGLSMYLSESDIKKILSIISCNFRNITLYIETMSPIVVKNIKEKSIEASNAKFTWGISSGKELESYNSAFKFVRDCSLTEGMKELYPVYKVISKIGFVRKISNKITVMTAK
ncbi:MAG: class I SAM-dependent methyltransferase [Eubacterium sp.]|nr:class I SAM-dependent methyltransferase [Eubacterium sp.]